MTKLKLKKSLQVTNKNHIRKLSTQKTKSKSLNIELGCLIRFAARSCSTFDALDVFGVGAGVGRLGGVVGVRVVVRTVLGGSAVAAQEYCSCHQRKHR